MEALAEDGWTALILPHCRQAEEADGLLPPIREVHLPLFSLVDLLES